VNHVLLAGRLEENPDPRSAEGDQCLLKLAVKRRRAGGGVEPGIAILQVTVPWPRSHGCEELSKGDLVAISALVEPEECYGEDTERGIQQRIVADWVERL
jgi:hypothetical protein